MLLFFLGVFLGHPLADQSTTPKNLAVETPFYQPLRRGFEAMDKVHYEAGWNGIPTTDVLLSLAKFHQDGEAYYKVQIETSNRKLMSLVWNPRNTIESVVLASTLEPKSYRSHFTQTQRVIDTTVTFNRAEGTVHGLRNNNGTVQEANFLSANTYDPLSATLVALSQDLKVGDQLQFDAFNGRDRYMIGLNIAGKEEIRIGERKLEAMKVVPSIANLLNPSRSRNLSGTTIWISSDSKPRVLRIITKAPLGRYFCDIVE